MNQNPVTPMSQSLAKLYVHLTFSTKHRKPWIPNTISTDLHSYMAGTLKNVESPALIIHSVDDYSHMLFRLSQNVAVAKVSLWQAYSLLLEKGSLADLGRVPQAGF